MPVWGCFSAVGPGPLVEINGRFTSQAYIELLDDFFLPYVEEEFHGQPVNFIQDRSPIHTARIVTQWFREHPDIRLIPWPAKGADLNPIENVWGDMVKDLNARNVANRWALFERVEDIWESYRIDRAEYWDKLAVSMTRRIPLVIENEGLWTGY